MNHPCIETDKKICGGFPVIKGTRTRVVSIAIEYEYINRTHGEIISARPHLKLGQVHDAISYYYYENRNELDEKIDKDEQFIQELSKTLGTDGN
jgi:uncharacterized protein (DUF433 family)